MFRGHSKAGLHCRERHHWYDVVREWTSAVLHQAEHSQGSRKLSTFLHFFIFYLTPVTALQDILIGPLCLYTMFVTWLVTIFLPHNNNKININNSKTLFMVLSSWQSHCDSSPGLFDECRRVPSGRRPKTKLDDLGCEFACTGCQSLHQPSPFIIITQPESWYSFYRSTEGRRLSRPRLLVTYCDDEPARRRSPLLILSGSDVAQLRWSRPTRYH